MTKKNKKSIINPEELRNWVSELETSEIDSVLEYLSDKMCLNIRGKTLKHDFWEKYIHNK